MQVLKNLESLEYFILSIFSSSDSEAAGGLVEASPVCTGCRSRGTRGVNGEQSNDSLFMY